jgi:hypothetical protein
MLASSIPTRFQLAWAKNAGPSFIRTVPVASQIGVNAGAASWNDGFVPVNFTQIAAGGTPPFGQDANGVLNETTVWDQWYQAGGAIGYDVTFATAIGGYPKGSIVQSNVVPGNFWMSTADNNTTDPDSVNALNWVPAPGLISSGTPVPSFSSTVPNGFVAANTLTIGNAASNGTGRANADTLLLYRYNWINFSNAACPIFTSAGGASARGANPDADFAANKALSTPDGRGRGLLGIDTMGGPATTRLNGVPVTLGNATTPGSILGENLHPLIVAELALHNHGVTDFGHIHQWNGSGPGSFGFTVTGNVSNNQTNNTANATTGIGIQNTGSGTAHNTVSQNLTVYWNIKL